MTNSPENFSALVERALRVEGQHHMRPVIEKELLHYDILFALDKEGLLKQLTFQGGTALRLCYGAQRFSEDLDFVGGNDFSTTMLMDMKHCIETNIGNRYGLAVTVKEPKDMMDEPTYRDIKIDKWQVSIVTAPARKDLPHQKIKIEVGNIPAYSRVPRAILTNYDFIPDGYRDMLIMTETLDEIMADKLIALVNCQRYVRHRDIWDLRWLKQRGAKINSDYIQAKIKDYHIENYIVKLNQMMTQLREIIMGAAFFNEISRFIPMDVQERTFKNESFKEFLFSEIQELLDETKKVVT